MAGDTNMKNPHDDPVWDEIGSNLKLIMKSCSAEFGIFMVGQGAATATLILGDDTASDPRRMAANLRLFRERLDEMIAHAEDETLDFKQGNQKFIRDSKTGRYEQQ